LFAVSWPVFPALGAGSGGVDRIYHLTLPAITLAAGSGAFMARITRASIRQEANRDYVDTARSRGLPESVIIRRHILRNALLPVVTTGGLVVIGLIAAAPIVETAFGLNGIGSLLIVAIQQKDLPVIQAAVLLLVVVIVVINALIDGVYEAIDPRLRTPG
jgi:peptide/nickel transport system permease protein